MEQTKDPHVMLLPFPAQGHVKPMLILAELLSNAGFEVTFVNTDHNHDLLLRRTDRTAFYKSFPNFLFRSISDGLPSDHPRSGILYIRYLFGSLKAECKPALRQLLISSEEETGRQRLRQQQQQFPTCIIADGLMSFAIEVAEELHIPIITFRTCSTYCLWIYFHLSKLAEQGEIPIQDENLDKLITCIPGVENIFRSRDLPSICRFPDTDNPILQFFIEETTALARASALILNTFQEIEGPVISKVGSLFNKIYSIGPLHALSKSTIQDASLSDSFNGVLLEEDKSCMTWLHSQASRSVLYISFGSLVTLTPYQILEFWHGIVNSGKRFLWVIRSDLIFGESGIGTIPVELDQGTKQRGCIVSWAPQEEVLMHPAVGGFLTHSGWNSMLESMVAGVPMICWPQLADQQVNSRCVSDIWKIGFDIKDTCDRSTVEKVVKDLMEGKSVEIMESTDQIAKVAHDSVKEGGSSYGNMEKLIEDIRSMARVI